MLLTSTARSVSAAPALGRRAASAIATKYSKALFGAALAKSPQVLTKVHTELSNVSTAIQKDQEVSAIVYNPTLSLKERNKGLNSIFAKLEGGPKKEPLSDITKNLFTVLSENGRLGETDGVIEGFNELVAQHKGELSVTVTSATPLPKDILTRLESTLKQSQTAKAGKSLTLHNKVRTPSSYILLFHLNPVQVNPSVLGGIIVDFGDKTIDLSVQSRVTKLNNVLTRK